MPALVVMDDFRAKRFEDKIRMPVEARRNQWKEGHRGYRGGPEARARLAPRESRSDRGC